jgi:hypothetical protein
VVDHGLPQRCEPGPTWPPGTPGGEEFPYSVKRAEDLCAIGSPTPSTCAPNPYSLGHCAQRDRSARSLVGRRWSMRSTTVGYAENVTGVGNSRGLPAADLYAIGSRQRQGI